MPWDDSGDYIRSGHNPPDNYSTCRTIVISASEGIKAVYCRRKDNPSKWEIQSYLFSKDKWDMARAKAWFADHKENFSTDDVDMEKLDEKSKAIIRMAERMHPDFEKIYNQFTKRYGKERGEKFYYAWLGKLSLDDSKPYGSQKEKKESYDWAKPYLAQWKEAEPTFTYWKVDAAFPVSSMNRNVYTEAELKAAARTLIGKPVKLNHEVTLTSDLANIVDAEYEDGAVEAIIAVDNTEIAGQQINKNISDGLLDNPPDTAIIHASLEADCKRGMEALPEGKKCCGLVFTALSLLDKKVLPGIPLTRFYAAESFTEEFEKMVAESLTLEDSATSKPEAPSPASATAPVQAQAPSPSPSPAEEPDSAQAPKAEIPKAEIPKSEAPKVEPPTAPAPDSAPAKAKAEEPKVAPSPEPAPAKAPEQAKAPETATASAPETKPNASPITPDIDTDIPDTTDAILTQAGFWDRFNLYHDRYNVSRQDAYRLTAMDMLKHIEKQKQKGAK